MSRARWITAMVGLLCAPTASLRTMSDLYGPVVFQFSSVDGKTVLFQFGHGLPAIHPEARTRAERFLEQKLANR